MDRDIVVIAESSDGRALPVAQDLIAFARALAGDEAARVCVILPGRDVQGAAHVLARETGADCLALEGEGLEPYNAEAWTAALATRLAARKPRYVLIPHTSRGCDVAPALAVRLGAACITAVEGVRREAGVMGFNRSIFNGKIRMHLAPQTATTVLTILPGACAQAAASSQPDARPASALTPEASSKARAAAGHVETFEVCDSPQRTRALGVVAAEAQDLDLTLADVIVCAGRGVVDAEHIDGVRRLAALFPKSAVGCSRPVCDLGWLGYKHQIGLTGRTVAPKLYIACGVSGAAQHLAGMRASGFVVAVNKDPHAAIFQIADVGVVEDLAVFIPLLIQKAAG